MMDNNPIAPSRMIFLVILVILLTALSKADHADITTIYQYQLDPKLGESQLSTDMKCQVFIHLGSTSKHLPIVIDNEIVFPKIELNLKHNNTEFHDIQGNNVSKENNLDTLTTTAKPKNSIIHKLFTRKNKNISLDEDLNIVFKFDSNNITNTHWTFDSRTHGITEQTLDTAHMGEMFAKLIEKLKVNYVLNDIDHEKLNEIVNKNNSKQTSTKNNKNSNVPSIVKLAKSFEHKCEGCRFDFYKTKNGTRWDLIIIRNYDGDNDKGFVESGEDTVKHETAVNDIQDKPVTSDDPTASESNKTGKVEMNVDINKSRQIRDLKATGENKRAVASTENTHGKHDEFLQNDQTPDTTSTSREITVPSKNKLLLLFDKDNDDIDDNEDLYASEEPLFKTRLTEAAHILKVEFKTGAYFKTAFHTRNTTDVYETIDITVRGACDEPDMEDNQLHVVVNTGSDFKTLTMHLKDARSQTMTIMFKSGSYIQILNGLVNHEVPLFGAQIYGIEFYSICFDNGFNRYQFDLYASSSSYLSRLPGQNPDLRTSLTSLWLTNRPEICLTIVYAMTSRSKDYEYVCYQDEMPNDSAPVKIQIETDTGRLHSVLNYCLESNGDIVRMVVNHNNTGIDDEIIRFLIQIEDKVHIRYIYNSICGNSLYPVKQDACDRLDKVAFDVAYKHNYYERASSVEYCGNGGKLVDGSCVCPPGFMGKHCEVACGENKFGRDCTGQCTRQNISSVDAPLECRGMLLCTQYGCGCAPGYQGKHCDQQCARGFYGNDCKTRCGQCINSTSCNIYTGHCTQCDSVYLIPPYCQESYPYVTKPLKVLNVSYFSIHLEVNAQPQYIKGYSKDLSADYFYVIRTKDLTWNTEKDTTEFALDLDNPNATYLTRNNWVLNSSYFKQDIWIHDLVPGHMYTFQLILYDDLNQTHDPNIAPVTRVMTKCIIPAYEHKTQVIVTSTTATVYWYVTNTTYNDWNITKHDVNDTTRISEINKLFNTTKLEVLEDLFNLTDDDINVVFKCREPPRYNLTVKKISKKRSQEYKFTNINSGFTLKYLDPGSSYLVRLYLNNNNYTYEILNSVVDTKPELSVMEDLEIVEKVGSVLTIKWSSVDQDRRISGPQKTKSTLTDHTNKTKSVEPTIYYIKYKIVKQRACNQYFNHNTMVESTNHTSFTLHLHFFTTYSIFVTTNKGQTLSTKYLYVSFDASVPNISPNLLHVGKLTNHSVVLAWTDISLSNYDCAGLNGMFVKYEVTLLVGDRVVGDRVFGDRVVGDRVVGTYVSDELRVDIDGLMSGTEYEVQLRYVNHVGRNATAFTALQFKTL